MQAIDILNSDFVIVDAETVVADAAKLMQAHNTGCLVVTEGDSVAGIITERDMVLGCLIDGHSSLICEVSRHMTILRETASPRTDIGEALLIMMDSEVSYLPVVSDDGSVAGLLYSEDLYRAIEQDDDPLAVLEGDLLSV